MGGDFKSYKSPKRVNFTWLLALLILTILFIPVSKAWGKEFKYWYEYYYPEKETSRTGRLFYALLLTIFCLILLYLLYRYTRIFYQ